MKTQLKLMLAEIYDIRPSEAEKIIKYLDNNITEILKENTPWT